MEILLNCILWYVIIWICCFGYVILDEYLVIRKYGRNDYEKFKPYDYKANLFITAMWPLLILISIYVFVKHYILKKD